MYVCIKNKVKIQEPEVQKKNKLNEHSKLSSFHLPLIYLCFIKQEGGEKGETKTKKKKILEKLSPTI